MKTIIICQDEPLFLSEAFDEMFSRGINKIDTVFLLNHSANGRRETLFTKAASVLNIFGFAYFLFITWRIVLLRIGRRETIEEVCSKHGVDVKFLQGSVNSPENLQVIKKENSDVLISIAGSQIFKKTLINIPAVTCLNLHNGSLPRFRGLMPVFWAMFEGESEIGVTIFEMDEGIDTGPIVKQIYVPVLDRSLTEMIKLTKISGMRLIQEVLSDIKAGKLEMYDNDDTLATYHSFPTKNDVKVFKANGNRLI